MKVLALSMPTAYGSCVGDETEEAGGDELTTGYQDPSRKLVLSAAGAVVALGVLLAALHLWPFDSRVPTIGRHPSLSQLLAQDKLTVGFLRYALVLSALFVAASIPVLVLHNRWVVKLSPSGLSTGELSDANATIDGLRAQLSEVGKERDEYRQMVESETDPTGVSLPAHEEEDA